jgi:hypothetical protein
MPADAKLVLLPMPGPPVVRRVAPQEPPQQLERPAEMPAVSEKRTPPRRRLPRSRKRSLLHLKKRRSRGAGG